ncbi:MAG: methanethiol S-methyltransferase [Methylophilaceae bacterium]
MQFLYFLYGVICYVIFFGTFLYAIGFVGNFFVPKSMDVGAAVPFAEALITNLLLLGVFAVQHSVMARKSFKEKWTKIIPAAIERNTYVLLTSLALILLFWQWKPMGSVIWDVSGTTLGSALIVISLIGWLIVLMSTFLIDHFELFGLKQAYTSLTGKQFKLGQFKTPAIYKFVRHPIYFGFTIAFWATPVMTTAHLLFAIGTLGYTFIGIFFEERDLVATFGDEYRNYKSKVSMLFPLPPKK